MSRSSIGPVAQATFQRLHRFVSYKARTSSIPGRVDAEEIEADVLNLIANLHERYGDVPDRCGNETLHPIDPESPEFLAICRRAIRNRILDIVRRHQAGPRDVRNERVRVEVDGVDPLDRRATPFVEKPLHSELNRSFWWLDMQVDPAEAFALSEKLERVLALLPTVCHKLWRYLVENPMELLHALDRYNAKSARPLKRPNHAVLAFALKISTRTLQVRLAKIREVVTEVFGRERIERFIGTSPT